MCPPVRYLSPDTLRYRIKKRSLGFDLIRTFLCAMASGSGCASPAEIRSEIAVEVVSQGGETLSKGCRIVVSVMLEEIPALDARCPPPGQSKRGCCDLLLGLGQALGFGASCWKVLQVLAVPRGHGSTGGTVQSK